MSYAVVDWAIQQKVGRASAKLVLIAMASKVHQKALVKECYAAVKTISELTEQDRKTVLSSIKFLKEVGLIIETDGRRGDTGQIIVYQFSGFPSPKNDGLEAAEVIPLDDENTPEIGTVEASQKRVSLVFETVPLFPSNSTVFPSNSTVFPVKESQKRDTEQGINKEGTRIEQSKRTHTKKSSFDASAIDLPEWLPAEAWAMWNRHRVGKRKIQTVDSVKLQLTRLKDYATKGHDPVLVIEHSVCSGWDSLYPAKDGSTLAEKPEGAVSNGNELPACPVQEIVDLYHEVLPELPRVLLMPEARAVAITNTWRWVLTSFKTDSTRRAETADEAKTWFRSYFERASMNDNLMGRDLRSGARSSWQCDLDHLLTDKGKTQVIEKTRERVQESFV